MSPFGFSPRWGQGFGSSHSWSQGFGPPSQLLIVGGLFAVLVLAGLVVFVVLRRQPPARAARAAGENSTPVPERLLAERYARGEFDDDEYQRRLHTLRTNYS